MDTSNFFDSYLYLYKIVINNSIILQRLFLIDLKISKVKHNGIIRALSKSVIFIQSENVKFKKIR